VRGALPLLLKVVFFYAAELGVNGRALTPMSYSFMHWHAST